MEVHSYAYYGCLCFNVAVLVMLKRPKDEPSIKSMMPESRILLFRTKVSFFETRVNSWCVYCFQEVS